MSYKYLYFFIISEAVLSGKKVSYKRIQVSTSELIFNMQIIRNSTKC